MVGFRYLVDGIASYGMRFSIPRKDFAVRIMRRQQYWHVFNYIAQPLLAGGEISAMAALQHDIEEHSPEGRLKNLQIVAPILGNL